MTKEVSSLRATFLSCRRALAQRFGRFLVVLYIFLLLFLTDWICFSRGFLWNIGPKSDWNFFSEMRGISIVPTLVYLNGEIRKLRLSQNSSNKNIHVVFLGDSTSHAAFDHVLIEKRLKDTLPGHAITCYKLTCMGIATSEAELLLDQIKDDSISICVYGFNVVSFLRAGQMLPSYFKSSSFESSEADAGMRIDSFLHRHWNIYKHRRTLKDIIYHQFTTSINLPKFLNESYRTDGIWLPEKYLQKWNETGNPFYYKLYMRSLRGDDYFYSFFRDLDEKEERFMHRNVEAFKRMYELCRMKNILLIPVQVPLNPIVEGGKSAATEAFVSTQLKPLCEEYGLRLLDLHAFSNGDWFADLNHLNAQGRKQASIYVADILAEEIERNRLPGNRAGPSKGEH